MSLNVLRDASEQLLHPLFREQVAERGVLNRVVNIRQSVERKEFRGLAKLLTAGVEVIFESL